MSEETIEFHYSPRQHEANEAEEQFLLYGGAKGGGKSWWLCCWAFEESVRYPGNRGFLGRKRGVDFNNTTLETWKKAIKPGLYKINEQKKRIFIPAFDSYIDYGGLDSEEDVEKFNSGEYGWFGIDQAEEVGRHAFAMLRGTLRHKLTDGSEPSYKVRLTANPAQCWLKDDFITKPKPGFRFIQALPTDNPFLASGYINNLREAFQHRPELLQAYLYGSWDELAGADIIIQASWVNDCMKVVPHGPITKIITVCDPARFGDDETVIYTIAEYADGVCAIINSEIVNHKSTMDTAGRIRAKRLEHEANLIVIDAIGIGAGIADRLLELDEPVFQFISSRKPTSENASIRYSNLRAQMWFEGAQRIYEKKVVIPNDDILKNQLCVVHYEYMSNGRFKVESKEDIKQHHGFSTDRADPLLMGIYGLSLADRIDADKEKAVSEDRQGRGEAVSGHNNYTHTYDEF